MKGRRVRILLLIFVSILFLMAHHARSQSRSTSPKKNVADESATPARRAVKKLSPAANDWVESTLRSMSVEEKIGQLLFTTYHGSLTALEARAVGVQWVYAPDADVNNNPGNPIVNTRSFGEDPARVAEFVSAFVRGVEENGALATAKHFPGHGDTAADSHIDLPVIHADRDRLAHFELVPFRAAIA